MTIRYLNPVQEANITPASLAPRLKSLEGIRLGLLANSKTNARKLLRMIAEELENEYKFAGIMDEDKGSAGNNCPPDLIADLVDKTEAVITGLGD